MRFQNKFRKKPFYIGCGAETKDLILEDQKGCFRGCEKLKYLGVKIDIGGRQENDIKDSNNKGNAVTAMLNSVLWNRQITRKNKLLIYNSIVKNSVTYGAETWKFKKNLESKLMSMEMDFLRRLARWSRFEKMLLEKKLILKILF